MKTSRMLCVRFAFAISIILSSLTSSSQTSCCELGKPGKLTMRYTGEDCSATSTIQDVSKYSCSGNPGADPSVYIIATDNTSPTSGKIWFSGQVAINSNFTVDASNAGQTRFASNTYFYVYNQQGGTLLQTIRVHTSCSVPIVIGDQWGSLVLESTVTEAGVVCGPSVESCFREAVNTTSCVGKTFMFYMIDTNNVAYWLPGTSSTYVWEEFNDGTVRIYGDGFKNPNLPGEIFTVDIMLSDATTSAPSGSPKSNYCGSLGSTADWVYYQTITGTVKSLTHGTFNVSIQGEAFQQGTNANTNQLGYGASGWLTLSGGDGFFDSGDINVMLSENCQVPEVESCCVYGFKPAKVTLRYTGEGCNATNTVQPSDKYGCSGSPNSDSLVYIIVNDYNNHTSGKIWFSGYVSIDSFFTINAALAGETRLSSNTVVHIFNHQGGTKIQTVNFHTSCSQPLQIGDQWGSVELIGIVSETGESCGSSGNEPPAPESCCVDGFKPQKVTLQYTGEDCSATSSTQASDKYSCSGNPAFDAAVYIIANNDASPTSGDIWFSGLVQLDSQFTIDATSGNATRLSSNTVLHIYNQQGGTLIQTINFHTSCSQPLLIGDQWGSLKLIGMLSETSQSCGNPDNPPSEERESCCVDGFRPQVVTLRYTGKDCNGTSTVQPAGSYSCSGDPASDPNVYIFATDNATPGSGIVWFSGMVALNGTFTFNSKDAGQDKLGSNTYFHIFNHLNGTLLQTVKVHTSCSVPLVIGDQWGSIELTYMASANGITCGTFVEVDNFNTISGYTFYDLNQNAVFDNGEPVIPTMSVALYRDNNCNSLVDGGDDSLNLAITNTEGFYQFTVPWGGGPYASEYVINNGNHDVTEKSDGSMDFSGSNLSLNERKVGLHFKDINVPAGATITSAHIEFVSYGKEYNAAAVRISADDQDNSQPFTGTAYHLTNRTRTTAQVNWTLSEWLGNEKYYSPDISSVIQELVDRGGWNSLNDISLLIDPLSGSGRRKAQSFNKGAAVAPRLVIEFDTIGYTECYITRVDTTTEPDGNGLTTSQTQTAVFTSGGNLDSMNNFGFFGQTPDGLNLITGTVFADYNEDALNNFGELGIPNIDVSLYIDANCDNDLDANDVLVRTTSTNNNGFYRFAVPYAPLTGSLSLSVITGNDDVEQHADGKNDLGHDHLHLNERMVGIRYQNIGIPQGATITSAFLTMVSDNNESGAAQVRIFAEDVNSSAIFSSNNNSLGSRTVTTASQNWNLGVWLQNKSYNSPEFAQVIQEVIDRPGWLSGNNLSIIIKSVNGSGRRKATSYNDDPTKAPKLFITYTLHGEDDCYLTRIGNDWPVEFEYLTTDSLNTQVFTGVNQTDSLNDFGLWGPTAVPVELVEFEVEWAGNNALLHWSTASEENNSHFIIERSLDGITFTPVGKVLAGNTSGYSASILDYSFNDMHVRTRIQSLVYYRLRQMDFDERFEFSPIRVLAKSIEAFSKPIVTYPNPADQEVTLEFRKNLRTGGTVIIMDMTGKVVLHNMLTGYETGELLKLNIGHLDRGIYFLQIQGSNVTFVEKLVVERK